MNEEIMVIQGIECYEVEGTAYLKLETVARGLGFVQQKNGVEYVRWETVRNYLIDLGFPNKLGKGIDTSADGTEFSFGIPNSENEELPDFIPENIFYRLAMKARNETAEKFQALIADEIIPAIRKTGAYIAPQAAPAALDAAAVQAFTAAMDTLSTMVQTLAQRLDTMEQVKRPKLPALTSGDRPLPVNPPSNKARRQWMRTASQKLNELADKCGLPSTTVLHNLYQEMEAIDGISLSEVRLKAIETYQLNDCSILLAIFYDKPLRERFVHLVEDYLADPNPFW